MCTRIPSIIITATSKTDPKDLPSPAPIDRLTTLFTKQVKSQSSDHSPRSKAQPSPPGIFSLKRKAPYPTSSSRESHSMIDEQLDPNEPSSKKRKTFEIRQVLLHQSLLLVVPQQIL